MRSLARLTLALCLLGGACGLVEARAPGKDATGPAPRGSAAEVAAAIDALRGVRLQGLSREEKTALGSRLDAAWDILFEHRTLAKKAIVEVLASEREDSFLLVDLSHLLTALDPKSLQPAVDAMTRADVTANPPGTFHAAANMAALHCRACLPAVLRILEIKDPDTSIVEHALPVDPELMLIFTLGQYGDDALAPVVARLSSENCVVRANAVLAVGQLQALSIPAGVRTMAREDTCDSARARAWYSLGLLDDPSLVDAAAKRLARKPRPPKEELLGMAHGLASSFSQGARVPLRTLAADSDPDVAAAARQGLRGLEALESRMAQVSRDRAGGRSPERSRILKRLEKAVEDGQIDLERTREELVTSLVPADIPLLNRARAAVLARLSDECLSEYAPLSYTVRALRHSRDSAAGPEPTPRAEP